MSNKTLKNSIAKIGLAPKKLSPVAILFGIGLLLLLAVVTFSYLTDKRITINGQRFDIIVANTPEERKQGLSNRNRLGQNQGMLFEYSDMGQYCMWMKDMKFSLDMLWINADKKIVHIQENATPESYPEETFCSPEDAKYVLELNAGSVKKWQIKLGDQVKF